MRNRYLDKWKSILKIKVEGKNINNYIKKIITNKINIIKLIPISNKEIHIILTYPEYQKLIKIKTIIYKTTILSYMGSLKIKNNLKKNNILIFFTLLGIISLIILSRFIFKVDIIHQDKSIRILMKEELDKYNIKKYHLKKSYQELENIEDKILKNNKDRLEWIEIIEIGTKYIVRVEERKITKEKIKKPYQNIISRKEGVIVKITAKSGEKLKTTNDYVKKGDIIIAGYITLPDNSKVPTEAIGEVLGEVWYTTKLDYPFIYQESKLTGKRRTTYSIYFNNKKIFNNKKYHTFKSKNKILLQSLILNICLVKEKQYETKVLDEVYTEDIAKNKAIDYIKRKLMKDNPYIKEITEIKILTSTSDEDSIKLNLFIKAIENIGEESILDKSILEEN